MNKKYLIIGALLVFVVGALGGNFITSVLMQPKAPSETQTQTLIGSPVPPFSLLALDGVRENSAQWQGKVQVINFWASWCQPCKREIPDLIELQNQFGTKGLQVIGLSLDKNKEQMLAYIEEAGINYPVLTGLDDIVDLGVKMGNDAGIVPFTVIISREGEIKYIKYGIADKNTLTREIMAAL